MKNKNIIILKIICLCLLTTSLVAQKKQYISIVPKMSSLLIPTIGVEYARTIYQQKEWVRLDAQISYDFISNTKINLDPNKIFSSEGSLGLFEKINLKLKPNIHHTNIGLTLAFSPNKKEKFFYKIIGGVSAYYQHHIINVYVKDTVQIDPFTLTSSDFEEGEIKVKGGNWLIPFLAFGMDWNVEGDNRSNWLLGIEIGGNFLYNFKDPSVEVEASGFFEYLSSVTNENNETLKMVVEDFLKQKRIYTYLSFKLGYHF